eukprot:7041522-Prymnesium_polylepis.1
MRGRNPASETHNRPTEQSGREEAWCGDAGGEHGVLVGRGAASASPCHGACVSRVQMHHRASRALSVLSS